MFVVLQNFADVRRVMPASSVDHVLLLKSKLDAGDLGDREILSVFTDLDALTVDRSLLAKTKVGVSVAKYKQHGSNDVVRGCRKLLDKWRTQVITTKSTPEVGAVSSPAPTQSSPPSQRPQPLKEMPKTAVLAVPPKAPKAVEGETVSETSNSIFSDSCDVSASTLSSVPLSGHQGPMDSKDILSIEFPGPRCFDLKRDRAREILFRAFLEGIPPEQFRELDTIQAGRVSASMEDALWDHHVNLHNNHRDYQAQLRAIKSNLADKKNPEFNIRIYLGAIPTVQLATLPSVDMASDAKKRERQKTKRDALEACQSDWDLRNIKRAEGQFPCGKCKSSSTTYFQMQTRSSDEPMTTFVSCLNCGNRWKF